MENQYILFQSDKIIACNKPPGMPVQPDKLGESNLLKEMENSTGKKLHLINRIDRPVSGVVLMTDDIKLYNKVKQQWHSDSVVKSYLAIVEGEWKDDEGELVHMLSKGRNHKAIEHPKGKVSKLSFKKLCTMERYTVLEISIHTGRFHQIRAQLSLSGHPIKGDVKYGARRKNVDRSIHLHSYKISIPGYDVFTAPFPDHDNLWKAASELIK